MTKYTLCYLPRKNLYFLVFGHWIIGPTALEKSGSCISMLNGVVTEAEANLYMSKDKIAVYRDRRFHMINIFYHGSKAYYRKHAEDQNQSFIGYLKRSRRNNKIYVGRLEQL